MATHSNSMMGITGFGAYIPRLRLPRELIVAANKWMSPTVRAKGVKAFCSWDEDCVTMSVEAARSALHGCEHPIESLLLASTTMPNSDLQHSMIVATVLDLPTDIRTSDRGFSQRAGTSALLDAMQSDVSALVVAADQPLAKPASPQELSYGAGAAAFTIGEGGVIARLVGAASLAAPLIDHFRPAGSDYDYVWEERWVREEGYLKLVPVAVEAALAQASIGIDDIHHFVLGAATAGVGPLVAKKLGFQGTIVDPLRERCGFTGVTEPLLGLAAALEAAKPGERILLLGFGQGCDALVIETTEELAGYRPQRGLDAALADGFDTDSYLRMLSFQGTLTPDWGMRGEKDVRTALTETYRSVDQIWKFHAGRCEACGTIQFPQLAYCVECQASSRQFTPVPLADRDGDVLTYTADWLTYYQAPPLYAGFVQFGDDARLLMEIVDVRPNQIAQGLKVRMVFRVKDRDPLRGWTRYFWKATPVAAASEAA